jgi:hypothetical protein
MGVRYRYENCEYFKGMALCTSYVVMKYTNIIQKRLRIFPQYAVYARTDSALGSNSMLCMQEQILAALGSQHAVYARTDLVLGSQHAVYARTDSSCFGFTA